jgi:hypothetical protein
VRAMVRAGGRDVQPFGGLPPTKVHVGVEG